MHARFSLASSTANLHGTVCTTTRANPHKAQRCKAHKELAKHSLFHSKAEAAFAACQDLNPYDVINIGERAAVLKQLGRVTQASELEELQHSTQKEMATQEAKALRT
jgi:hypothetical protein